MTELFRYYIGSGRFFRVVWRDGKIYWGLWNKQGKRMSTGRRGNAKGPAVSSLAKYPEIEVVYSHSLPDHRELIVRHLDNFLECHIWNWSTYAPDWEAGYEIYEGERK